jgi:hypothetical protein
VRVTFDEGEDESLAGPWGAVTVHADAARGMCRRASLALPTHRSGAADMPLPDQGAGALDRLSQRRDFTSPDEYVFV